MTASRSALAVALLKFRDKYGHFPGCAHGVWARGYGTQKNHAPCPLPNCDGSGMPCVSKCAEANRALALGEDALVEQGALL